MNLFTRIFIVCTSVLLTNCTTVVQKEQTTIKVATTESEQINTLPVPQAPQITLFQKIINSNNIPHLENALVKKHKLRYKKNTHYIEKVLKRAEPFLFFITQEIEKRDLPLELALIPVIESAYLTTATSKSNAAGLWQFIPSTGRYFNLKQNWWSDQRRDTILSTRAALDYLKTLNKEFNGDWHLSIAAYNGGRGTIKSAIKKNKRKNAATDYSSLKLSKETQNYVPKLIALLHVMKNANAYNIQIPKIKNEAFFTVVKTQGQTNLNELLASTNINQSIFKKLNAGFKRWASSPEGPHRLVVPINSLESTHRYLASQPHRPNIQWHSHKLKKGDTLYGLALKYNVSVSAIKSINGIKSSKLRAGKTLLIPL